MRNDGSGFTKQEVKEIPAIRGSFDTFLDFVEVTAHDRYEAEGYDNLRPFFIVEHDLGAMLGTIPLSYFSTQETKAYLSHQLFRPMAMTGAQRFAIVTESFHIRGDSPAFEELTIRRARGEWPSFADIKSEGVSEHLSGFAISRDQRGLTTATVQVLTSINELHKSEDEQTTQISISEWDRKVTDKSDPRNRLMSIFAGPIEDGWSRSEDAGA